MSNRFHNKYHRHNHHTSSISIDIDSSLDPIASPEYPFLGSFNVSGDIVITGDYVVNASVHASEILIDSISSYLSGNITVGSNIDISGNVIENLPLYKLTNINNSVSAASDNDTLIYDYINSEWISSPLSANFASDAEAEAGIIETKTINPKQLHFVDYKFVPFSDYDDGSLTGLTQSGAGNWNYYISGFEGNGLSADDIREIFVEGKIYRSNGHDTYTQVTLYDSSFGGGGSTTFIINWSYGSGSDGDCGSGGLFPIPINRTTTRIYIQNINSGEIHIFRFVGAKQRDFTAV